MLVEQLRTALNIFANVTQHLASARGIDVQRRAEWRLRPTGRT
jgi:hypothetical protein